MIELVWLFWLIFFVVMLNLGGVAVMSGVLFLFRVARGDATFCELLYPRGAELTLRRGCEVPGEMGSRRNLDASRDAVD
jgi:hypothetical protein